MSLMMWKTVNWLIPTTTAKWHDVHHPPTSSNDFMSCIWSSYTLIILQCPDPDEILSPTVQQVCMEMHDHHILPADINIPLQYGHAWALFSSRNAVSTLWTYYRPVLLEMLASFACSCSFSCLIGTHWLHTSHIWPPSSTGCTVILHLFCAIDSSTVTIFHSTYVRVYRYLRNVSLVSTVMYPSNTTWN